MQNMKHKLTFIVSLGIALILTAVIGATVSLHHCMKWDAYCDNGTLPSSAVKFTQNLIFHAYYWMGDSLHLLMPGCRHAGMVFPPSAKTPSGTERHDSRHIGMRIQKNTGEPLYQRNHHRRHDPPKPPPSGDLTGLSP